LWKGLQSPKGSSHKKVSMSFKVEASLSEPIHLINQKRLTEGGNIIP
jgi:hypothetical protein